MEKKDYICSICGDKQYGYGNNPEPIHDFDDRCCDVCNSQYVIPARLGYKVDLPTKAKQ